jgi:hypothetical protein
VYKNKKRLMAYYLIAQGDMYSIAKFFPFPNKVLYALKIKHFKLIARAIENRTVKNKKILIIKKIQ